MSKSEAMLNAMDLMIHSVYKPDHQLRLDAKECGCYDELMIVREAMISHLEELRKEIQS